jgi:hypothetical protein
MKNEFILWLGSVILVFLIGYIKNVTDKDYPITGTFGIEGKKVSYKLDKISYDKTSYKNIVITDIDGLEGKLIWVKNGLQKEVSYKQIGRGLECEIPWLSPGQQINYKVVLTYGEKTFEIPSEGFTTLTFYGSIPSGVKILTFIFLYGGLLMSFRSLLELFNNNKNLKKYSFITCTFFLTLTSIIIPLRNSYKLGAINNYVPPIFDLLDPILLVILFLWIAGTVLLFHKKYTRSIIIMITSASIILFFFLG